MDSGQAMPSDRDNGAAPSAAAGSADAPQAAGKMPASDGLVEAGGRDSFERAAAVLAGAGQDVATAQDRLGMLGQLPELPADRYLDREESWLRFAQRVLELAEDPNVPLLERVRFESIFASALDEFFMVRVAGRIRRMATGLPVESVSGKAPDQILENTLDMARELAAQARALLRRAAAASARRRRHRDPALEGADPGRAGQAPGSCSGSGSTRSSRRWPSTRRTRSRSSPGCRSAWPSWSPTRGRV